MSEPTTNFDDGHAVVEMCGLTLRIPTGGKVPLAAFLAFRRGDEFAGTELLFGPEQWTAFLDENPTVDDFAEIGRKILEQSRADKPTRKSRKSKSSNKSSSGDEQDG